ncbi:MAG: four helix bundle protein [Chryseobacterium sp.]|nr:MAG: four helix bundle protein [Chryseobacterium sp.]
MRITTHQQLNVYCESFGAGMEIFTVSKTFPKEELYSLTDQIRRSSRSVSGNIAEAWRKRRYEKAFIAKLSDAEGEAAETQVWLEYALACHYIQKETADALTERYNKIIGMIVTMIRFPEKWKV